MERYILIVRLLAMTYEHVSSNHYVEVVSLRLPSGDFPLFFCQRLTPQLHRLQATTYQKTNPIKKMIRMSFRRRI